MLSTAILVPRVRGWPMSPLTVESSEWVHPGVTSVPCRAGVEDRSVRRPLPWHLLAEHHRRAPVPTEIARVISARLLGRRVPFPRRPPTTICPNAPLSTGPAVCGLVQCRTDAAAHRIPQESVRVIFPYRQRPRRQLPAPDSADSEYGDAGQRDTISARPSWP